MIINISERTDIVNYYTPWLINRLKEGYVYSRNPYYREQVYNIDLNPKKVDGLVFCSKNYENILKYMEKINSTYHILAQYTITSYNKDVEPNVASIDKSIQTLKKLSQIIGPEKVVWRFDPILLTEDYTISKHMETFEYILSEIHEDISFCIFSFVDMYQKVYRNMKEIIPFKNRDIEDILSSMSKISQNYNIVLQNCCDNYDFEKYGILQRGCITKEIFEKSNKIMLKDNIPHKGNRKACKCMPTRDIGAYNSCLNECKYCYANKKPDIPKKIIKLHDEKSPLLIGHLNENDKLIDTKPANYIKTKEKTLFDYY